MALPIFQSFMPTVARWVSSAWRDSYRVITDNETGAPVGLVSQNANGPQGIWAPTPLSAAQIAAPTAEIIADLNATYQLNAAPWTRYQSNGTILIAVGSGSVDGTTFPAGLQTVLPGTPLLTVGPQSYEIVYSPFTVQNDAGVVIRGSLAVISATGPPGVYPVILGSGKGASVSSGTAEAILANIAVPAGLMGLNGSLRITMWWTWTNSGNNKVIRVRFSGIAGTIFSTATATNTTYGFNQVWIRNNNSASAQRATNSNTGGFSVGLTSNPITGTIDTSAATTACITGQPASDGETITLNDYTVEFIPGV